MKIPFNKPHIIGHEMEYIRDAIETHRHISGNGVYTHRCHDFFKEQYGFEHVLLTSSGTDALEMAAILCDIKPGDEVIMPSYTFVSTANAFVLRGAHVVFVDSCDDRPHMDENQIEAAITDKTKVIVVVHYGGVASDMDVVMELAERHSLVVVEDAAHAIDSYYKGRPLGGIGHLAAFSFHETKNIISGEGGMLVVNDPRFVQRSEYLWEKGTNRMDFSRGDVAKYEWVDVGSSYLPSDMVAAFLYGQLEHLGQIQDRRCVIWNRYYDELSSLQAKGKFTLARIPEYATLNGHLFYLECRDIDERNALLNDLKNQGICVVFHYIPLHESPYYRGVSPTFELRNAHKYGDTLIRLPLFYGISKDEQNYVIEKIKDFFLD